MSGTSHSTEFVKLRVLRSFSAHCDKREDLRHWRGDCFYLVAENSGGARSTAGLYLNFGGEL